MSAIFFLVVVSLLALAVTRSVRDAATGDTLELLGVHALTSAETGAQLAVAKAMSIGGSSVCTAETIDLDAIGYPHCTAATRCLRQDGLSAGLFEIESLGRCQLPSGATTVRIIAVKVQS
ncbi:MAG: hypothetical protein GKR90_11780 [Pseudomonadales bacterium]|nr:hypothetical protein [Pseudomonadales bacterium]